MPCRYGVKTLAEGDIQHSAKLQRTVTVDAGVWCFTGFVNGYKTVLDLPAEFRP